MIYKSYVTSAQRKLHGPLFRPGMVSIILNILDLFGDLKTYIDSSGTWLEVILTGDFENLSQFYGPCVGSSENKM